MRRRPSRVILKAEKSAAMGTHPVFGFMILAFLWISLNVPVIQAAGLFCSWDKYLDSGTGRCEHCSDLCLPARQMMEECAVKCKEYVDKNEPVAKPIIAIKTEEKTELQSGFPSWAIAILVVGLTLTLVVLTTIGSYQYLKWRRENNEQVPENAVDEPFLASDNVDAQPEPLIVCENDAQPSTMVTSKT